MKCATILVINFKWKNLGLFPPTSKGWKGSISIIVCLNFCVSWLSFVFLSTFVCVWIPFLVTFCHSSSFLSSFLAQLSLLSTSSNGIWGVVFSGFMSSHTQEEDESGFSDYDSQDEEEEEEEIPWITWFCSLKGNEFFCEVDEEYIQVLHPQSSVIFIQHLAGWIQFDWFGNNGPILWICLRHDPWPWKSRRCGLFDNGGYTVHPSEEELTDDQQAMVEGSAETLYGLIHARFILTNRGMKLMVCVPLRCYLQIQNSKKYFLLFVTHAPPYSPSQFWILASKLKDKTLFWKQGCALL